jgi:hypothetical protein
MQEFAGVVAGNFDDTAVGEEGRFHKLCVIPPRTDRKTTGGAVRVPINEFALVQRIRRASSFVSSLAADRRPGLSATMFTNALISGGQNVSAPGSQSKLVTTVWASKDANFGIAISHWYDSH